MDEIARYRWLGASPLGEAACVTIVEGMDLGAVAAAFGGSLGEAADVAFDGARGRRTSPSGSSRGTRR